MAEKQKNANSLTLVKETEAAPSKAAASVPEDGMVHVDYVGPNYHLGIKLPGRHDLIRPREFTPAEIGDFTEKHPEYTHWWTPAGK